MDPEKFEQLGRIVTMLVSCETCYLASLADAIEEAYWRRATRAHGGEPGLVIPFATSRSLDTLPQDAE